MVKGLSRPCFLYKVSAQDFFFGHDVVEQVGIRLAFAHRQSFIQVILGDDRTASGRTKDRPLAPPSLVVVNFLALQHVDCNAQTGRGYTRVIGYRDGFEIRVRSPELPATVSGTGSGLHPRPWAILAGLAAITACNAPIAMPSCVQ